MVSKPHKPSLIHQLLSGFLLLLEFVHLNHSVVSSAALAFPFFLFSNHSHQLLSAFVHPFSAAPTVSASLSVSVLSSYLPSAFCGQSPRLLLVPGSGLPCNQTPGISGGATLTGRHNADKTL